MRSFWINLKFCAFLKSYREENYINGGSIMYLLTEREYVLTSSQIFSPAAWPHSVNKYIISWPLFFFCHLHSFLFWWNEAECGCLTLFRAHFQKANDFTQFLWYTCEVYWNHKLSTKWKTQISWQNVEANILLLANFIWICYAESNCKEKEINCTKLLSLPSS